MLLEIPAQAPPQQRWPSPVPHEVPSASGSYWQRPFVSHDPVDA
jgi:hypothetical protein